MYAAFENELGKIDLNGGIWRIKEIDGIGFIEKTCSVVTYSDTDGQELISSATNARYITISGDILARGSMGDETGRAIKILNKPGWLRIQSGSKQRRIACRCSSFSDDSKNANAIFKPFVVQFVADYPYFEDFESSKMSVFLREDMVRDSFTLPCIFTVRSSRRIITNAGAVNTTPIFYIICNVEGTDTSSYGIEIINHTTNQSLRLLYKLSAGETITINLPERSITSDIKTQENNYGNLIAYFSEDTFLSNFYFKPGINDVECRNYDMGGEISAAAEFSNKYVEAVI